MPALGALLVYLHARGRDRVRARPPPRAIAALVLAAGTSLVLNGCLLPSSDEHRIALLASTRRPSSPGRRSSSARSGSPAPRGGLALALPDGGRCSRRDRRPPGRARARLPSSRPRCRPSTSCWGERLPGDPVREATFGVVSGTAIGFRPWPCRRRRRRRLVPSAIPRRSRPSLGSVAGPASRAPLLIGSAAGRPALHAPPRPVLGPLRRLLAGAGRSGRGRGSRAAARGSSSAAARSRARGRQRAAWSHRRQERGPGVTPGRPEPSNGRRGGGARTPRYTGCNPRGAPARPNPLTDRGRCASARPSFPPPGGAPLPARHQASPRRCAPRRPADHPVRRRGGRRRRDRAGHHRHLQPEAGDRGSLRPQLRARAPPGGAGEIERLAPDPPHQRPRQIAYVRQKEQLGLGHAVLMANGAGRRTSRSRSSSRTTSSSASGRASGSSSTPTTRPTARSWR